MTKERSMTTKTIRKLEGTCQRLENSLRKNRNLLVAARQRASRREVRRRDRKYLALGYAVDAVISHIWSEEQTRAFDLDQAYLDDEVAGTPRMQRIKRGIVACALLLTEEISLSEMETAARRYLRGHQQTRALQALADRHWMLSELAQGIAAYTSGGKEFPGRLVINQQQRGNTSSQ
jgi:hypothetical protein